jgi:hypothetical protein
VSRAEREAAQRDYRVRAAAPHVARKAEAARQAGKITVSSERGASKPPKRGA